MIWTMIWPSKKCLVGPRISLEVRNPKILELETAKEILGELFDIRAYEVDEMIRQRIEDWTLYGQSSVYLLPKRSSWTILITQIVYIYY